MKINKKHILFASFLCLALAITACRNEVPSNSSASAESSESSTDSSTKTPVLYEKDEAGFVYIYDEQNKTYEVKYAGDRNVFSLEIPSMFNDAYVTSISDYGFNDLVNLAEVTFPEHLAYVGTFAFDGCSALSTINYSGAKLDVVLVGEYTTSFNDIEYGLNAFSNTNMPKLTFESNNIDGNLYVTSYGITSEFDSINYDIKMNEDSPHKASGNFTLAEIAKKNKAVINLGAHGMYRASKIELVKDDEVKASLDVELGVYNSMYNVAFLSATYPVTVFSLKAHQITENGTIPTYTFLERNNAFDWNNLQYSIHELPNTSFSNATSAEFSSGVDYMNSYIKDLYEANPSSSMTFYVTDLCVDMVYKFFVANRIPESFYNIVMLSDGTASAALTAKEYGVENPTAKFETLYNSLSKVKNHIWQTGEFDLDYIGANLAEHNPSDNYASFHFANHAYTTLKLFNNCSWWVNRFRTGENLASITQYDSTFANQICADVTNNIYTNSLLAALNEEELTKFKALFHFDTEMFDQSRDNGKKIMVILGTSWSGEKDNLYNLMKATMDFYGDTYDYYYKPHPGWPTSTCQDRNAVFDKLKAEGYNFTEIDGALAAEIIMFFNNDIYLSGYSSTTYASLDDTNKGMGAMTWNVAMPNSSTDADYAYKPYMYTYLTLIAKDSTLYTDYALDSTKTYYLIEFNDYTDSDVDCDRNDPTINSEYAKHDKAIYCLEDGTVTYYKNNTVVTL